MGTGLTAFESAVRGALDELGVELLERPREFVGAVSDLYDSDSPELVVLYAHCGDELMRPYVEAARERTEAALGQAARRAELWLHDARRVDAKDARTIAWGVARGVAAHLGVELPESFGGGPGEDELTEAALARALAVLANPAATEADVAWGCATRWASIHGTSSRSGPFRACLQGESNRASRHRIQA